MKWSLMCFNLQIVNVHFNESIHQSQDVIMVKIKSSDKEEFKSKHDIIDIKEITNDLSANEILQLINKEMDTVTNSETNTLKSWEALDKLSTDQ